MKRLLNAAVALAATLVVYQAYVLGVVPIVEPALPTRAFDPASEEQWRGGERAVARYQKLLANYLPAGHWVLSGTPQVYEYGPLVLALDDFQPIDGGRIEISRSVLVAFPTPRTPGATPPRDAIIVEAPGRARIQFDEVDGGLDFTSGRVGRPVAGEFLGELLVRSDMHEPGPEDDLRIVTRDLRFNQAMITTNASIDLQLGPHRAHGKVVEVRLLKDPYAGAGSSSMQIAGVESLEIREQVQALIDTGNLSAAAGSGRVVASPVSQSGVRLASAEAPVGVSGPLEITSAGSFRFNFTRFVASLENDVRATLRNANGPSDQLYCRELRLHFGDDQGVSTEINPDDEPDLARRQGRVLAGLEPRLIEAVGAPVRFDSPSRSASVRGRRLRAWVVDRRLRIEGAPAKLAQGLSEAQAPVLEYTAPAADSQHVVGELLASGPGWLRVTPSPDDPDRSYQARWSEIPSGEPAVTLRRDNRGQPVLSMVGRPEFAAAGLGKMRADRVVAQLREVPADGKDGPAIELANGAGDPAGVLLHRIDAVGAVEFIGRQVEGYADDMVAMVRPIAAPASAGGAGPSLGSAGGLPDSPPGPDDRRFRLRTKSIQLDVGLAGRQATPVALICSGGIRIEEEPRDNSGEEPLQIVGQQLRVDRLDRRGAARLTIAGDTGADTGAEHTGLAEIRSQGLRVWVRDLHVDQAAGRAWTEGRGDARLRLPAGDGSTPFSGDATLRWRGGMQFDGSRLALSKEVFAETAGGWLNCAQMAATLSRPIDLTGASSLGSGGVVEVAQVECSGGVTIDYRSTDDAGQRSHERAQTSSLAVNRLTGAISGRGPGSIRSVRLASDSASPLGGAPRPAGGGSSAGLKYLRVDFRDGLGGNYQDRAVRFLGGVQTVYGPVLAWDHQLPLHSPEGVPPDAVELSCEELRVHETPSASVRRGSAEGAPMGPIELLALGDVRIDALIGEEGGSLVAEAARASYSQAADRFIIEGDGQQLVQFWSRQSANQPFAHVPVQRLTYYLADRRIKAEDIRGGEYHNGSSAGLPTPPRR